MNQPDQPPTPQRRTPPAPPPREAASLPERSAQPPAERIVVQQEKRTNPLLTLLKIVTWPFAKVISGILWLIGLVVQEMVRSVVRFILGLIFFAALIAITTAYIYALIETNYDFVAAITVMFEVLLQFLPGS